MTVISSREFAVNQKKYFDLAINEEVCIKRGKNIFQLIRTNGHNELLEHDEDLHNAITAEELLDLLHKDIHRLKFKTVL